MQAANSGYADILRRIARIGYSHMGSGALRILDIRNIYGGCFERGFYLYREIRIFLKPDGHWVAPSRSRIGRRLKSDLKCDWRKIVYVPRQTDLRTYTFAGLYTDSR